MARSDQAKNTLKAARVIRNLGTSPQFFSDSVGKADKDDLYYIQINNRSTLNLNAVRRGSQSRVSLQLFSLKGAKNKVLRAIGRTAFSDLAPKDARKYINFLASRGSSGRSKTINLSLNPGTYYVRVHRNQGENRYRLSSSLDANTSSNPPPPVNPTNPSPNNPANPSNSFRSLTWIRQFGTRNNDYAFGTDVDTAGDVYLAGVTTASSAFNGNGFVAKYGKDGSPNWQRSLSISGSTLVSDVAVDVTGNYYAVGAKIDGTNSDAYIAKYNSAGTQQWIRTIESTILGFSAVDAAASIFLDGNDIYVTGIRRGAPAPLNQGKAFVAKYTSAGNLVDQFGDDGIVEFGSNGTTAASGVTVANGAVYITGITAASLSSSSNNEVDLVGGDAFVAGFDRITGNSLWNQTLSSGPGTDYGRGIAVNGSDLYIVGQTVGTLPSGSLSANTYAGGEADAFLAKYTLTSNSGTLQWTRQIGGAGLDAAQAVAIDPIGKIYFTGETNTALFGTAAGGSDAWIAQADSSGNLVSATQLGTPQDDEAYGIVTDSSGALYVIGQTQGTFAAASSQNQGNYDVWLAKYS